MYLEGVIIPICTVVDTPPSYGILRIDMYRYGRSDHSDFHGNK